MAGQTLLIVDDHPLFVEGFTHMARALRPEWRLHTADCAVQALGVLDRLSPAVAVIDVGLPERDGFALLAALVTQWPELPVIFISGREDAAVRVRAQASGARGFIVKTISPEAMVSMIDAVLDGGTAFSPIAVSDGMPVLTTRQAEILSLLGEGHANKEIRHRLGIAERTVRAHLTELFHLLGANSRMQAVIRSRELGLIAR